MGLRNKIIIGVCLVAMAGSLSGAALLMQPINDMREDLQLSASAEVLQSLPPQIAIPYAALGSFRGLLIDFLWARMIRLKRAGKYFDAIQLAQWITTLQPHIPAVWAFHAWNLAYNISVASHTPEERWMWVQAGFKLLRNKGIPLNPRAIQLYRELSWIFLHKIGMYADNAHWYYKKQIAERWNMLLGTPPQGESTQAFLDWFRPIAQAYKQYLSPEAREQLSVPPRQALIEDHPKVADLINQLHKMDLRLNQEFLKAISHVRAYAAPEFDILQVSRSAGPAGSPSTLEQWLNNPKTAEARQALIAFTRAKVIHERYHMSPAWMFHLMKGKWLIDEGPGANPIPIDWRHPAAHGLYWATRGVHKSLQTKQEEHYNLLNTYRLITHALQSLTQTGDIIYNPVTNYYRRMPNPRFIKAYAQVRFDAQQYIRGETLIHSAADVSFAVGHENFLTWALQLAYFYGDQEQARRYYQLLRQNYKNKENPYTKPLEKFVMSSITTIINMDRARSLITGLINKAITQGLVNGKPQVASRFFKQARALHRWYQKRQNYAPIGIETERNRLRLPPFEEMVAVTFRQFMTRPLTPSNLLAKIRAWRNAPRDLRLRVFNHIKRDIYQQARQVGLDPVKAFPPPDGSAAPEPAPVSNKGASGQKQEEQPSAASDETFESRYLRQ